MEGGVPPSPSDEGLLVPLSRVDNYSNRFLDTSKFGLRLQHSGGPSENWPLVSHIFSWVAFFSLAKRSEQVAAVQEEKPPRCAFHIPVVPPNHC